MTTWTSIEQRGGQGVLVRGRHDLCWSEADDVTMFAPFTSILNLQLIENTIEFRWTTGVGKTEVTVDARVAVVEQLFDRLVAIWCDALKGAT